MRKTLIFSALVAVTCFAFAGTAKADSVQLQCTSSCTSGSVSLLSAGTTTFNFVGVSNNPLSGSGFIAILVPTGGAAPTLSGAGASFEESVGFSTGSLNTPLGGEGFDSNYNFSALSSLSGQAGVSPSGYTVYEFALGSVILGPSMTGPGPFTLTAPVGSVAVGWLEGANGTLQTPFSESITVTPEPASLTLLGLGLVGVPFLRRRKA